MPKNPAGISLLLLLAGAAGITAQPAFDAASVKPNHSGAPGSVFRTPPGRFEAENQPLKQLLLLAYGIKDFQLAGDPDWASTEHFDITATATGNPSRDQILAMLQNLLQERFNMTLHRETRQLPIYELAVAKGGLKLEPVKCFTPDRQNPSPSPAPAGQVLCGGMGWGNGKLDATGTTLADFAFILSGLLGRPIVDKTGLDGAFPVHLKYAPDNAPPDSELPSVFTAMQEQLGLKLDSARGPVEVLVIDNIRKLTEN